MSDDLTKETLLEFVRDPVTGEANTWFWPALISQLLAEPLRELPYRLVGTSLLVVYESGKLKRSGVAPCQDEWNGFCAKETKLEARYIDFCHAVLKPADQQVDENFEGGLKLFQRFVDSL
jgi:1D-myo-inositol-tetrakisphosphate 5-kinase/inositol-polyphosphate multikinase